MSKLNLSSLSKKLDDALKKETPESLSNWLEGKREIKFRSWDKDAKYMDYQGTPDLETIQSFMHHFGNNELMQFTGMKDSTGKEIYEGDIDEDGDVVHWCDKKMGWALATYDHEDKQLIACHCYHCEGDYDITEIDDIVITGNVHER